MSIRSIFHRYRCLWIPLAVVFLLALWSLPSLLMVKKVLGFLLMPTGLVWLGLLAMPCLPGLRSWSRRFAILVLLAYSLAGNAWFGGWLLGRLEAPYAALSKPDGHFDAICVLGGGSSARPDASPQLGPSGDRLIVPAACYLAGNAGYLVASGLNVTDIAGRRSLADDTAALWHALGIPDSAIIRLSEPRTTKEEIRAYRKLMDSRSWKRVGVCTSAWHLRRVEKLCRKEGVEMIPVPADFLSSSLPWVPMYAVPQARGFHNVQKAVWEFLGGFTGG